MWATLLKAQNPSCAWCHEIAFGASDVDVKVLTHFPSTTGHVLEEVEIRGGGWQSHVERIRALASVHSVSVLESASDHARVRIEVDDCPLQHAVAASGAVPRFPFRVKQGYDEWLLITERENASRFVSDLRSRGVAVEVVSSREYHPHEGLTDRQKEFMRAAIEHGYYEVPRRVSLTELARRLHVAKSTLSETLARGERRVVEDLQQAGS
jgi:predicted DNA binding protein